MYTTRNSGVSPSPYDTLNLSFNGGDESENVRRNRQIAVQAAGADPARLTLTKHVHGDGVAVVTMKEAGAGSSSYNTALDGADALVTSERDLPLAVLTADCPPIAIIGKNKQFIGAVHAGSEGVYLEIVPQALRTIESSFGVGPEETLAFIGPGIQACCYEVSEEQADRFAGRFGGEFVSPDRKIDLPGIIARQLEDAGIPGTQVCDSGLCTSCREELFFSYRRDKVCGRQALIVVNQEQQAEQ